MTATLIAPATSTQPLAHVDLPLGVHKLLNLKGQFVRIVSNRSIKVRKGKPEIVKRSEFTIRVGCDYDALKSVKEGRESGILPEENQGMWGEWIIFPILKTHKGGYYIRCTAVKNNDNCKPTTAYFRNGALISLDEAKIDGLASEFYEKDLIVFDIKVENIESINGIKI